MSYQKAKQALNEMRVHHIGRAANDPKMWDLSLGLEQLCDALHQQLSNIEYSQQVIIQLLQQRR